MFHIGLPKKDTKKLSIIVAFGLAQHYNKPCNLQNEFDAHLHEDDESDSV